MPFFDIFASPGWSPLRMRTKVVSFFSFFKSFQTKKKLRLYDQRWLTPRLHVSGSSGYPAPDRPFVYTYPGQMYAIRSITVRYPERFENDFKGGQPGSLDPFSSSVNGVPGYPDRFWIQFSMAKKNSGRLFTCRACSLSGAFRFIFVFDFLYFHSLPPSRQK